MPDEASNRPRPIARRAGDHDRERTVAALRWHFVSGRLSAEELERRTELAYAGATRAELRALVRDLPRRRGRSGGRLERWQRAALRAHAASYATVNGSLVGIWALTGEGVFWPAFSLLPWGAMLGWHLYGDRRLRAWRHRRRPNGLGAHR